MGGDGVKAFCDATIIAIAMYASYAARALATLLRAPCEVGQVRFRACRTSDVARAVHDGGGRRNV